MGLVSVRCSFAVINNKSCSIISADYVTLFVPIVHERDALPPPPSPGLPRLLHRSSDREGGSEREREQEFVKAKILQTSFGSGDGSKEVRWSLRQSAPAAATAA